jgi:UDP-N-acetylglucosamine acyltransferase
LTGIKLPDRASRDMKMETDQVTNIDPRAVVHPEAELDHGVSVGPFAVIGPNVRIGSGTTVGPHAVVEGRTTMGKNNRVFQFASIGADPQDLKYAGEDTGLTIGDGNTFRECCTVNKGTEGGINETRLGNGILLMAYSHVAHDCVLGDGVIFANCATLGGHVTIGDGAIIGGLAAVHQFCRVGALAMLSGGSMATKDVPPYTTVQGDRASMRGLNLTGLQRSGFSAETIAALKSTYRIVFRSGLAFEEAVVKVRLDIESCPEVDHLLDFLMSAERGFVR